MTGKGTRHILCLSGGKDSAALAVYLEDRILSLEYVFLDTDKELPETYAYLASLEAFLGKPIVRLNDDRGFDHWLAVYGLWFMEAICRQPRIDGVRGSSSSGPSNTTSARLGS